jgi:sarcosine oxidase subunit beta
VANKQYDAIIIGAGIIGACTAYELAKKGYKTLSVDTLPTSGYGSTSNSCAIVRAHYSTEDGVATAYEGFYYWDNWREYLGVEDPSGMAEFRKTGSILLKSDGHDWRKVQRHYDAVGVEYHEWTMDEMKQHIHIYTDDKFWPPSRPEDDENFMEPKGKLEGVIFCPGGGYVNDPQLSTHNVQVACRGQGRRVHASTPRWLEVRSQGGKV